MLHMAAENGCLEVAQLFTDSGADLEATDDDRDTALHLASASGHLDLVKFLVEKNANIHVENGIGDTPLRLAARSKMKDVIRYLVEKGAADRWLEAFGDERPEDVVEQLDNGSLRNFIMRLGHPDSAFSDWESSIHD
ncbi:hypothetical protein FALCPG4_015074 [Fusarium falciforme]